MRLLLALICLAATACRAGQPEARALREIHARRSDVGARITEISALFLGVPYQLGPLGEGQDGEFDRDPLVDYGRFDCTTYVEEVMALALEPDPARAEALLQKIRYKDGKISYQTRNHFPEVDWIPNNVSAGFLKDITSAVGGSATKIARKTLSKRAWYEASKIDAIQGFTGVSDAEKSERLTRLRALGASFKGEEAAVPYVPIEGLAEALDRIPSGTIVNFLRENRPGKPVLITHQGFLVDKDGAKILRHAAEGQAVVDVPFLEYLARHAGDKWPLLGVNLNQVLPRP